MLTILKRQTNHSLVTECIFGRCCLGSNLELIRFHFTHSPYENAADSDPEGFEELKKAGINTSLD